MTPKQLLAIRKRLGLTQKQLADALGCDVMTVSRYERGEVAISHTVALAVEHLSCEPFPPDAPPP